MRLATVRIHRWSDIVLPARAGWFAELNVRAVGQAIPRRSLGQLVLTGRGRAVTRPPVSSTIDALFREIERRPPGAPAASPNAASEFLVATSFEISPLGACIKTRSALQEAAFGRCSCG